MQPGKAEDISFALDHIAYRVPAGHRLRVSISTAYWPLIWPSPDAATLTLTAGDIALPQRPTPEVTNMLSRPPPLRPRGKPKPCAPKTTSGGRKPIWSRAMYRSVIEDDFGKVKDADHGLIAGSVARERWTIHPDDPL